jgi:hypothetical protein
MYEVVPNTTDSRHLIVDNEVVEPIPLIRSNPSNNWVRVTPFGWDARSGSHGHEDPSFRACFVQVFGERSALLPV